MTRGRISVAYTVACGCWAKSSQLPRKRLAIIAAERDGYRFTRKYGWLCPACQEEKTVARSTGE